MTSSDFCGVAMPPLNISECYEIGILTWFGSPSEAIVISGLTFHRRIQQYSEMALAEFGILAAQSGGS